jgi:hypothetical protein
MADTLDLLFGNWIDGVGKNRSLTRVVRYDSGALAAATEKSSRRTISTVVQNAKRKHSSGIRPAEHEETKRKPAQGEEPDFNEPIQVHRIPLQPVLASTVAADYIPAMTPFRWGGILPENFTPQVLTYGRNVQNTFAAELVPGLDKFLIPLLNSSYDPSNRHFVGVQMTEMLVNEIARLVQEYDAEGYEIGLLAEQSDTGNYFLRLFTSVPSEELGGVNP